MKKYYKNIFEQVKKLVNEWDPCSFIESGAPDDEYDVLTNKLLSGLINKTDTELIKNEIIDLLGNYYGTPLLEEINEENKTKLISDIEKLIENIEILMPTKNIVHLADSANNEDGSNKET